MNSAQLIARLTAAALLVATAICAAAGTAQRGGGATATWISFQSNGKLAYKPMPKGDHIMDFSTAGYGGGGIALPTVPVVTTLSPSGKDDSAAIQAALDDLAKRPLVNGLRGALLLKAGAYQCASVLEIKASGVVLRGEGTGPTGTVIQMTGKAHQCITLAGVDKLTEVGQRSDFTDAYVPSGTATVSVANASHFKPGDSVLIERPATPAWIHFMGMDTLVRSGKPEHWVSGKIPTERTVQAVDGDKITLDAPLTDSFDAQYIKPPGGTIVKVDHTGRISQVGIESLSITAPPQHVELTAPSYRAMDISHVLDGWIRDVEITDTLTAVGVTGSARVTIENVGITHTTTVVGAAKPADFNGDGTQILFDRCHSKGGDEFYFVTGARVTGPVVVLNCIFHGNGSIQPHQRWATGLLVDNCEVPEGTIDFIDRGVMGSGHGWTIGWSVAWNCTAKSFEIEQPPGSMNWAIGCRGAINKIYEEPGSKTKVPEGIYDSQGTAVAPSSLYLTQLLERAGPAALKNIGY